MLKADQAFYGKKGQAWYIWDTERENGLNRPKGGWIESKKWYTERGIESKNNMHGTRFCFASKEKLLELGIEITGLSV